MTTVKRTHPNPPALREPRTGPPELDGETVYQRAMRRAEEAMAEHDPLGCDLNHPACMKVQGYVLRKVLPHRTKRQGVE